MNFLSHACYNAGLAVHNVRNSASVPLNLFRSHGPIPITECGSAF